MDKKFTIYSKLQTVDLEEPKEPSYSNLCNCQINSDDSKCENSADFANNNDSEILLKNVPNIVRKKPNDAMRNEAVGVKMLNDDKARGITSLFTRPHKPNHEITKDDDKTSTSEMHLNFFDDKDLAMAVRLPPGTTTENVAVTIELEANKRNDESSMAEDSNEETMVMRCCGSTESETVFTGVLRLSSSTDISKLANMPLYLVDSNEKLMLNPGTELSYIKRIRPSEDMLLSDDEAALIVKDIKVKLKLNKLNNKSKISEQKSEIETIDEPIAGTTKPNPEEVKADSKTPFEELDKRSCDVSEKIDEKFDWSYGKSEDSALRSEIEIMVDDLLSARTFKEDSVDENDGMSARGKDLERINKKDDRKSSSRDSSSNKIAFVKNKLLNVLSNYNVTIEDLYSSFLQKSEKSEKSEEEIFKQLNAVCARLKIPLEDEEFNSIINKIYRSTPSKKPTLDSSTQYSVDNFTKEIPVQTSLSINNKNYYIFSPTTTEESQTFISAFKKSAPLDETTSSKSSETALPKSTTSATVTTISTALISGPWESFGPYKVPSNTPSSSTQLRVDRYKKIKNSRNDADLSLNGKSIKKITLTYKKPEKLQTPICIIKTKDAPKHQSIQTEAFSFSPSHIFNPGGTKVEDFSSTEDELASTIYEFPAKQHLVENGAQTCEENVKQDKTLQLLQSARYKLLGYLEMRGMEKSKEAKSTFSDMTGSDSLGTDCEFPKNVTEIRNIIVDVNNPFNPYARKNQEDVSSASFQEYYQKCKQNKKDLKTFMEDDLFDKELDTSFPKNAVFQVYPLIFNNNAFQIQEQKSSGTSSKSSKDTLSHPTDSKTSENSIGKQLKSELDSLQNMYNGICESMKAVFDVVETPLPATPKTSNKCIRKSGKIETIGEDLMHTFDELKSCLTTINQILSESTSPSKNELEVSNVDLEGQTSTIKVFGDSDNHKELQQTYFTMEDEIERTIKELLKESECIRETVILNGGKEEAEPPFMIEYIDSNESYNTCKKIFENIFQSSTSEEFKDKSKKAQEDIKQILNILLEDVEKRNFFLKRSMKEERRREDSLDERATNLQSGDVNTNNNRKDKDGKTIFGNIYPMVYFQNALVLNSKIPKTSFSFGETPNSYVEIPNTNCKTPARQRDGLTVTNNSTLRTLETSRLFNELIHLQESFNQPKSNEGNLYLENENSSIHLTIVMPSAESPVHNKGIDGHTQDLASHTSTNTQQISTNENPTSDCPDDNENLNNEENANSEENSSRTTRTDYHHSANGGIKKSKKGFELNKQTGYVPTISAKTESLQSTDEEVFIQDFDLTRGTSKESSDSEVTISEKKVCESCPFTEPPCKSSTRTKIDQNANVQNGAVTLTYDLNNVTTDEEMVLQTIDLAQQQIKTVPERISEFSKKSTGTTQILREPSSCSLGFMPGEILASSKKSADAIQIHRERSTSSSLLFVPEGVSEFSKKSTRTVHILQGTSSSSSPEDIPEKVSDLSKISTRDAEIVRKPPHRPTSLEYAPEDLPELSRNSTTQELPNSQILQGPSSSLEDEIIDVATRNPRSQKKKDSMSVIEIMKNGPFATESISNYAMNMKESAFNSEQGLMNGSSHYVLRQAEALQDIQEILNAHISHTRNDVQGMSTRRISSVSDLSAENIPEVRDSDYESDRENIQIRLPNLRYRYKSQHELNSPEEIAEIELNVRENDKLERMTRMVLAETCLLGQGYEDAFSSVNGYSKSSFLTNDSSLVSGEIAVIEEIDMSPSL